MLPEVPEWASNLAWVCEDDEALPPTMDGINVVLNRARLASYLAEFGHDRDIRDLLVLDVLATAAGLPFSSTGLLDGLPTLALRPFRIWEYTWLYKVLGLGNGDARILDLGGPGTHVSILAALAGCSVTSIDINPEFVRAAQECAEALCLSRLSTQVGDMRDLSGLADESFDAVISCSVLEHLTAGDQETALEEMARVLKPGGMIGLTFDYGPAAPGANEYLPPPHDPPPSAEEALRRYARAGLAPLGNAFVEDPIPGALFHDERVRYTIASLFLGKPPVPDVRVPRCECTGSVLGSLVISMLPSRIHGGVVRTRALLESTGNQSLGEGQATGEPLKDSPRAEVGTTQNDYIVGLERMAERRLADVNLMHLQVEALRQEADERLAGLNAMHTQIAALRHVADERLAGLNEMHTQMAALRHVADERLAGLNELHTKMAVLRHAADERLAGLNEMHTQMAALRHEADQRERGLHELTAIIAERDARIAAVTQQVSALENETLLKYLARRARRRRLK